MPIEEESTPSRYGDEWNLGAVIGFFDRNRGCLLLVTVLGAALGVGASYLFRPIYRADAVLIISDELSNAQAGSVGDQLGMLGALVGFSPAGEREKEALATLKSRALAETYIREENLLPILFPTKWDQERNNWKPMDADDVPTPYDGYKLFDRSLRRISENKKDGVINISVEWTDRRLAEKWTRDLVDRTNEYLRDETLKRSSRNLEYLNQQAEKTAVVEVRSAIYKLIETEIKKIMVAQGSKDFAFRFVDPPVLPRKKVFPNRVIFALAGAFLSLVGCIILIYRREADAARQHNSQERA